MLFSKSRFSLNFTYIHMENNFFFIRYLAICRVNDDDDDGKNEMEKNASTKKVRICQSQTCLLLPASWTKLKNQILGEWQGSGTQGCTFSLHRNFQSRACEVQKNETS